MCASPRRYDQNPISQCETFLGLSTDYKCLFVNDFVDSLGKVNKIKCVVIRFCNFYVGGVSGIIFRIFKFCIFIGKKMLCTK